MRIRSLALAAVVAGAAALALGACGSSSSGGSGFQVDSGGGGGGDGAGGDDGGIGHFGQDSSGPDAPPMGCTNLQCDVKTCSSGSTTITGTVTDPAGKNPLYNVVVYVPNSKQGALQDIPLGITSSSCSCGSLFSGEPIVYALTAADGTFTLKNPPAGKDIPVVVQIGKWRKEIVVPSVAACAQTKAGKIALPKNGKDGLYASLPSIAVSTGGADALECLLTRVGLDAAEFTGDPKSSAGHVHVFQGAGGNSTASPASPVSATSLWDSKAHLDPYDIVMLSCEGAPTQGVTAAIAPNVADYVNAGGRLFAEHYHYAFFTSYDTSPGKPYPQFPNVATWSNVGPSANDIYSATVGTQIETKLANGQAFPEGQALEAWLGNVGALTKGELLIPAPNGRFNASVGKNSAATAWAQTDKTAPTGSTQYFSWDMPFEAPVNDAGVPGYCGRVVYSDLHVAGSHKDYASSSVVPGGCVSTADLSQDEDALEFILFDLSSCVTPVGSTPTAPMGAQ